MAPPTVVGGEVGDGILGEGYEGEVAVAEELPFIGPRCPDICEEERTALSAADAGSRVCSMIALSWVTAVGEAVFGGASMIFLVEYCRFKLAELPGGVGAGGERVSL